MNLVFNCCGSLFVSRTRVYSLVPVPKITVRRDGSNLTFESEQVICQMNFNTPLSSISSAMNFNMNSFFSNSVVRNCNIDFGTTLLNGKPLRQPGRDPVLEIFDYSLPSSSIRSVKLINDVIVTLDLPLGQDIQLNIEGAGDIIIKSEQPNTQISATIMGSGDITGSTVKRLDATIMGSGDIEGFYVLESFSGSIMGGCIPVQQLDTPVDYESLTKLGSIMGSGDIKCTGTSNCRVNRNIMGSGKIKMDLGKSTYTPQKFIEEDRQTFALESRTRALVAEQDRQTFELESRTRALVAEQDSQTFALESRAREAEEKLRQAEARALAAEQLARTAQQRAYAAEAWASIDDNLEERPLSCSICMDNESDTRLSCGHARFCQSCALGADNCPMCKKPITSRERIYL